MNDIAQLFIEAETENIAIIKSLRLLSPIESAKTFYNPNKQYFEEE